MQFNLICNLMFMFLLFISFILMMTSLKMYFLGVIYFFDWELFSILGNKFNFIIYLDFMASLFLSLVCFISSLIMIYSKIYMEDDLYKLRFIYVLILFVMSMGLFILSPNLISILLGWDGLGLVSYCLIIHYQNFSSDFSGMLTALSNRIGDSFLIISICIFFNMKSWNFLFISVEEMEFWTMIILIFASITKSAQIPFSSWLPAAMAAPTPVSSLVHSSTLVTAGIYLMIRFNNFLMSFKICSYILMMLSLVTLCMAGISANLEMDFKKIIALSTLSQLGMMMSSLSMGLKEISFFHLVMHALFKANMFMCSGNFIHLNLGTQDLRFYGKTMFISPLSYIMFCLSNLSLCGLPFLCGFYSKDLILELILMNKTNLILFFFYMIGTSFTVMYTFRVLNFSMKFNLNFFSKFLSIDSNKIMNFCMFPLFLLSVISGSFFCEVYLFPLNYIILPLKLKTLILFICLISLYISFILKSILIEFNLILDFLQLFEFMNSLMYLVFLSKKLASKVVLSFSKQMFKTYSDGWIEYIYGLFIINYLFKTMKKFDEKIMFMFSENIMNFVLFFLLILLLIY